ncbi:MAG: LEA type 2 family protein [Treponema sp.]|nr:LEA type 2 family protein [Treponema sp.]
MKNLNLSAVLLAATAAAGLLAAGLLASCKTPPQPPEPDKPYVSLKYVSAEAGDTAAVNLGFVLDVNNPAPFNAGFTVKKWTAVINGIETPVDLLSPDGKSADNYAFTVGPGTVQVPGITEVSGAAEAPGIAEAALVPPITSVPLSVKLNIPALAAKGIPLNENFTFDLTIDLAYSPISGAPEIIQAGAAAVFPLVQEPVFSITAIAILKAELINTRFRVTMKIDNPNYFPVDLSFFSYELYGNGLLWADGTERSVLTVPARASISANLFLIMNFINMKRDLLDQIIKLEDVNYRFAGNVMTSTGIDYLPRFKTEFDLGGYSKVYEN